MSNTKMNKTQKNKSNISIVCSVLAFICCFDFLVTLTWTSLSITIAIYNPQEAYIVAVIILALNCVAISFAACFLSFKQQKNRTAQKCLRFYRCHRLGLACISLLLGIPLFGYSLWFIIVHWSFISTETIENLLREPYLNSCLIVGGFTLFQGVTMFSAQKCFTNALLISSVEPSSLRPKEESLKENTTDYILKTSERERLSNH